LTYLGHFVGFHSLHQAKMRIAVLPHITFRQEMIIL
jgi:hypothetical protein